MAYSYNTELLEKEVGEFFHHNPKSKAVYFYMIPDDESVNDELLETIGCFHMIENDSE